jgi:eukaryotic-like serine/threonine-protein kinase
VLAIVAASFAFLHFRETPAASAQLMRFQVFPPENANFLWHAFDLSPDGRHLAFTARGPDGRFRLWVRDLDALEARPLAGTEDNNEAFWSPDNRTLGFAADNKLEKIDISGGPPQTVCNFSGVAGGAWNQDGVIIFGSLSGIWRVSAAGGTPSLLTKVDASRAELSHQDPSFLPDGQHFLYVRWSNASVGTYVGSLDSVPEQQSSEPLLAATGRYVPTPGSGPERLLFEQNSTLMAQSFDASRMELKGNPAPIAQHVANFVNSANGILAYMGFAPGQLTWFDRHGKTLGTLGEPDVLATRPAISPDGSAVAVDREDPENGGIDLWLYNLMHGTRSRLTFDGQTNQSPVWSPDAVHIAFVSARNGGLKIHEKAVNGTGQDEILDKTPANSRVPTGWSPDGRYLIEDVLFDAKSKISIWTLPLSAEQAGGDRKSSPYLDEGFNEGGAKLSPNGQWLAYASDETGRSEIYVQTFPKLGGKWTVSINGGAHVVWSADGKELYFIGLDGKLMAVNVKSGLGGSFEASTPKALFDPHIAEEVGFDVSKDGWFLIPTVVEQSNARITIVVNWTAGLNK